MIYIIIYALVASLTSAIQLIYGLKKLKSVDKTHQYIAMMKKVFSQMASFQNMKKKVWNWYMISFVYVPMGLIVSQFIFPITILTFFRKLIFGKTKLEKKAAIEKQKFEELANESEEFMKIEADIHPLDGDIIVDDSVVKTVDFDDDANIFES